MDEERKRVLTALGDVVLLIAALMFMVGLVLGLLIGWLIG